MAKTLIIGATGHLGQQMLTACKKRGHEVHVLLRPETLKVPAKMNLIQSAGAVVHEGDVGNPAQLLAACRACDNVISTLGGGQLGMGAAVVKAVKEAGVKRFVPSDFGLDPKAAGRGSCVLFDIKADVQEAIKKAGVPYTFVHTGGFYSYWVLSLGDLSRFGGPMPPAEVNVYGDGNTKGSLTSIADIASLTVRALDDPAMRNRELRISGAQASQNELIALYESKSGKKVKRNSVSAADLDRVIASATAPDQMMMLVGAQLHRSMWIRGDSIKTPAGVLDASKTYSDFKFQTVSEFLKTI